MSAHDSDARVTTMTSSEAPTSAASAIARPGQIVGGKFRVEQILGEGGMGVVVSATHLQLREPVALKFLRGEMTKNQQILARFRHEARAAAKLRSDHVARTLDVGEREDGVPYIVMEYLEGRDLSAVLHTEGALPVSAAVEYVIQACDGLAEAHARHIIHLDIKPENIFLVERDGWRRVKVLDFGISKAALAAAATPAELAELESTVLMGSPHYMSPEQIQRGAVDLRSDIWSLGAVLFELLAGMPPFDSELGAMQIMHAIVDGVPRSLRELRPEVPLEVDEVVRKCLRRDRTERYANAAELAIDLLPFAPRRARAVVERAVLVTKSAGLAAPTLELPASVFPIAPAPSDPDPYPSSFRQPDIPSFSDLSGLVARDDSHLDPAEIETRVDPNPLPTPGVSLEPSTAGETAAPLPAPPASRKGWLALLLVPAAAAAFFAWQHAAPIAPAPVTNAANATTPAPPPQTTTLSATTPGAQSTRVNLSIAVTPKNARVSIDDAALIATPVATTFARDATVHHVHIEAPHFQPKELSVTAGGDTTLEVVLEPIFAGGARPPPHVAHAATDAPVQTQAAPPPTQAAPPPAAPTSGKPKREIDVTDPYAH